MPFTFISFISKILELKSNTKAATKSITPHKIFTLLFFLELRACFAFIFSLAGIFSSIEFFFFSYYFFYLKNQMHHESLLQLSFHHPNYSPSFISILAPKAFNFISNFSYPLNI